MDTNLKSIMYGWSEVEIERIKQLAQNVGLGEMIDEWGLIFYGNDDGFVEYNLCLDNTGGILENCSSFYRIVNGETDCSKYYHYEIDFSNPNWRAELQVTAKRAFKELFVKEC